MTVKRWIGLFAIGLILLIGLVTVALIARPREQIASLPTLALLPSATPSFTPTDPPTPTPTPIVVVKIVTATALPASATLIPTATLTPSPTFTATSTTIPSATITDTITPVSRDASAIPAPTLTPIPPTDAIQAVDPQTYYVTVGSANLRKCARKDCEIVAPLVRGDAVTVVGYTTGDTVSGSNIWYAVKKLSYEGYVHSSLVALTMPATATYTPFYVEQPPSGGIVPATAVPPANTSGGIPCADGTISHAAHRQGACSHHGGIAPGY